MALIDEIFESFALKTRPNIKWKMAGDMPHRIKMLKEKFQGVKNITELGTYQGCSTALWLSLRPEKLTCIDIGTYLDLKTFQKAADEIGTDFKFIQANSLDITIEPCELLFIDTVHREDHVYQELTRHADKVSKFLAFHDVNEELSSTIFGIRKWHKENPNWKIYYENYWLCGFLILEKI